MAPTPAGETGRSGAAAARRAVVVLCLAATLGAMLPAAWWTLSGRLAWPQGDEPHYLIMSASVIRDADFRLRNNYRDDIEAREIYGLVEPHAYRLTSGWWPYHTPGLSVLVAIPWLVGGTLGVRLALCGFAALLAWACWRWLRGQMSDGAALWATGGVVVGPVVLFGASQIYPDLAGGVVPFALVAWLWGTSRRSPAGWVVYWTVSGLLCWLHVKYAAPAVILAGLGGWQRWRDQRADGAREWAQSGALFLIGPLLLAWFHLEAFGTVLGGRNVGELTTSLRRAAQLFLGLHLDQAQGMFFQQPLVIPGLWALGDLLRRRHRRAWPWLLLYASLIVPNALELARYGGAGPAGRFGWSAMWLWLIPIGIWAGAHRATVERYVRPVVLAGLAYQLVLAVRWIPAPSLLFPVLADTVWARNSLFPLPVRYSLPSFYFWDWESYLWYVPNVVWVVAAGLLIVSGYVWSVQTTRRQLGALWTGVGVVAAVLLPVEPTADARSAREADADRALLRTTFSQMSRRFEAEQMPPGPVGIRRDEAASQGSARIAPPGELAAYGPPVAVDPGRYSVVAAMRLLEPTTSPHAARVEMTASLGVRVLDEFLIPASRLPADGRYASVGITFETAEPLEDVEFRLAAADGVRLLVDYVDLIPILPRPAEPTFRVGRSLPAIP